MNPGQLQALFTQHKVGVLGAAAAGVVLLGLRARKKTTGGAAVAGARPAGSLPAAAVVPANGLQTTGSTYDSSAYDVYSALQSELQAQTTGRTGVTSLPPVASSLFAPSGSGQLARYGDGSWWEMESDGSLFGLTQDQANAQRGAGAAYTQLSGKAPATPAGSYYTTQTNLAAKAAGS